MIGKHTLCNCPAGFSAEPERHAPDCPGRSGAGKPGRMSHERFQELMGNRTPAEAAPAAEPVMWVNPHVIGADKKINWPTAITFSKRGPCYGWTFPLYAEPQHDAELVELLTRCQEQLDPHRHAVLWGEVHAYLATLPRT